LQDINVAVAREPPVIDAVKQCRGGECPHSIAGPNMERPQASA
jgi:hypothetical protein